MAFSFYLDKNAEDLKSAKTLIKLTLKSIFMKTIFFPFPKKLITAGAVLMVIVPAMVFGQTRLSIKEALRTGLENYGIIKAKSAYAAASKISVKQAKLDYLPNVNLSAQADYGTANGQNGPAYVLGPSGIASTGLPLASQNWNAAFGGLYLTNVNWDFFAFGRSREKIKTAVAAANKDELDKEQEIFQEQVRVAAAYLNLLAAQRLTASYRKNLARADTLRRIIVTKAQHDLVAGVDSSQANAEVSNSKSILLASLNNEQDRNADLIKLLGIEPQQIATDTVFIGQLPKQLAYAIDSLAAGHPVLAFYNSRVKLSRQQANYYHTLAYPTFTLGTAIQTRGSGFASSYTTTQPNYSTGFYTGISPDRTNYVVALGITWNLTQPFRIRQQLRSQNLITEGLNDELAMIRQQLSTQLNLADAKIKNSVADYYETPQQVKAANDAYNQKLILYKHGLTGLVDVTQALYVVVRAETTRDISYTNVWQALLLKAAAQGSFAIFSDNL
jgi:outer membrane protein TolC